MRLSKYIKVSGSPWVLLLLPVALVFSIPLLFISALDPKSWKFNKDEARTLLREYLNSFKQMTTEQIRIKLTDETQQCVCIEGPSNTEYQIEITPVRQGNDLRLLGGIDDGRLRAFFPLSEEVVIPEQASVLD